MNSKWPFASVRRQRAPSSSVTVTPSSGFFLKRSSTVPSKFTCGPSFTSWVSILNS